jgi:hypothetical protein
MIMISYSQGRGCKITELLLSKFSTKQDAQRLNKPNLTTPQPIISSPKTSWSNKLKIGIFPNNFKDGLAFEETLDILN